MWSSSPGRVGFRAVTGGGRVPENRRQDRDVCLARERADAACELVENDAQREQIRPLVHVQAFGLLRRHVVGGPEQHTVLGRRHGVVRGPAEELRQPEVDHLHVAVGPHHHVFRLDVAMHDAARVCDRQRRGHLNRDADRLAHRNGAAVQPLPERVALDQFADDERPTVDVAEVVNHQDVRMVERRGGTRLGAEPSQAVSVAGDSPGSSLSATGRSSACRRPGRPRPCRPRR